MTMKIVKVLSIALLAVAVSAGLTACMNDGGTTAPQQTTGFMPETTAAPNADMTATQPPVAFDWVTGSGTVEASVNRISEISDCRVVAAGTTALVGVKFTNAYQGDLTERIRQMVAAEVVKADPSIQTVAVTAEPEDVNRVYEISEALRAATRGLPDRRDQRNRPQRNDAEIRDTEISEKQCQPPEESSRGPKPSRTSDRAQRHAR